MIKLFNTETREKEPLKLQNKDEITLYTCGPTVYHYAHIGNFRTYVFEDLLRRTLESFGHKVKHVMNLTDVDDKTIRGATRDGVTLDEYTQPFKDAFFEDVKSLNIEPAHFYPAATDYVPQMIEMIQTLLDKGVAYQGNDGSVYFAIQKFPRYGCLSHLDMSELKTGASERISADEYEKDSLSDFVLWKGYDPERDGSIYWESPFGKGRPGWHLECSAMAMSLLGETVDIHVGGVDNMFPHHENEIAQSESCSGKRFVNHWLHSEHLIVNGKKMSKSLGNFYTLRDLLDKGYTGREVRYMLLHTHYKTQLNFTLEGLDGVRATLGRLKDFVIRVREISGDKSGESKSVIERAQKDFNEALADDLNISQALAVLFDFVREVNGLIDKGSLGDKDKEAILEALNRFDKVIGVIPLEEEKSAPQELLECLQKREVARKEKNWALADELRDKITTAGWAIEDTPTGARLKKV
ncbi:MAG: cysteine--tRNA ligase [Chlamydiia bacterium]|nr:cysteine--tRNA ligase [Chlamydiia bacterium]